MTTVKHYKGPVRADGTPIDLPKKVLKLQQTQHQQQAMLQLWYTS